jgi:hypothetical protein
MANFQSLVMNQLGQGALGTAVGTFYTVPASTRTLVKDIDVANNTGTAIAVTVYLVKNGGTPGDGSNTLLPALTVPANSILQWTGNQVLLTGATVQALASATGLSFSVSGAEGT